MSDEGTGDKKARLSRRSALRAGATAGAVGAGVAAGLAGSPGAAALAAPLTLQMQMQHHEIDLAPAEEPVNIVRAGGGPPQRGDWFYVDAPIFEAGKVAGPQIGVYQCFGAWTNAANNEAATNQRFTCVQFHIFGKGALMGLINEDGTQGNDHVGAVIGGTGQFLGAHGSFRQVEISATPFVARAIFDVMLPMMG